MKYALWPLNDRTVIICAPRQKPTSQAVPALGDEQSELIREKCGINSSIHSILAYCDTQFHRIIPVELACQ